MLCSSNFHSPLLAVRSLIFNIQLLFLDFTPAVEWSVYPLDLPFLTSGDADFLAIFDSLHSVFR